MRALLVEGAHVLKKKEGANLGRGANIDTTNAILYGNRVHQEPHQVKPWARLSLLDRSHRRLVCQASCLGE